MKIDWGSLGLVAVVTIGAAMLVVGVVSLGLASLQTADRQVADGRPAGTARVAGYACVAAAGLMVLYGLYLIIPQFH